MFRMKLAPPIEDRVFLFTRWTLRTVSLRAVPSGRHDLERDQFALGAETGSE